MIIYVFTRANLGSQANSYNGNSNGNSSNSSKIEIVDKMQVKVNEMCTKIDELERQLDFKCGAIERKFQSSLYLTSRSQVD